MRVLQAVIVAYHLVLQDQITLEELNVLDKLPHYCPVCAYHEWNLDGLVEMTWQYAPLRQ
jgi:ribosome-interacting GTPase 1